MSSSSFTVSNLLMVSWLPSEEYLMTAVISYSPAERSMYLSVMALVPLMYHRQELMSSVRLLMTRLTVSPALYTLLSSVM